MLDQSRVDDSPSMMKFEDVAMRLGWSLRTLERRIKSGKGPRVTKLSARERRIRTDHYMDFLNEKAAKQSA